MLVPLGSATSAAEVRAHFEPLGATEDGEYVTLADTLQAPNLTTSSTGREDPGYLLATPGNQGTGAGPAVIYDNSGQLIWMRNGSYYDLEQIEWQGQPALALYDVFAGGFLILDQSYNQIATVAMQNQPTDAHDIEVSPDGSRVLLQGWAQEFVDLSPWGGPANGMVLNPVVQEQVIGTGQVTFEWSTLDHISPGESTEPMTGFGDLFHSNSLEYDTDGNILISYRNTSTVYKIDRNTGEVIWRFGGKENDFTFTGGEADMPSYQHDARRLPNGEFSVFDNGNTHNPQESRGVIYDLDETTMTATVVQELRADPPAFTPFIGNNRQVSNGNQLVGFGATGRMVEYADGQEVFSGQFDQGWSSYRAERTNGWVGTPSAPPDVVVRDAEDGTRELFMSWNGATEVASWRIEAGPDKDELTTLGSTPKTGFETGVRIYAPESTDVFRVTALDDSGNVLHSRTVSAS